ncbi:WD40 repeat [Nonomuraea maritima]|uniref:WD40 repeat n=1 Tax=Nonomuraea maritima TaxID=683260 RepID=A0A1G8SMT2_9ACTN|nr:caspase family protein [Nonomuraea maritima]SDJ30511.1 WD40 repeat [Nonomuraea maritima]
MSEDESATFERTRPARSPWNGPPLLLASEGARVVVAGTGAHAPDSRLPRVAAVRATVTDLGRCLVERAGLPASGLSVLLDPAAPADLSEALERAAREATSVLMFHYVGHGVFGPDHELYLATHATTDLGQGPPGRQALPYATARQILASSSAEHVVMVLDCCFTGGGRPIPVRAVDRVFHAAWPGAYVLASSSREANSWALPGVQHTALTGALLRLLAEGDPAGPEAFTLDHLHHHLARALPAAGFPRPRRLAGDPDGLPPLASNPAQAGPRRRRNPPSSSPGDRNSPYRGLAAYEPEHAGLFFGREEPARALATRVRRALRDAAPPVVTRQEQSGGPILVTGPSGCGKSSLLRAGLIPALRDGRGQEPPRALLTPGARPLTALARAIAASGDGDPERLRTVMESDPGSARRWLPGPMLLVVDQFEEVFTACSEEAERRRFAETLAELSRSAAVVIAVRGDFYGHCAAYPGLLEAVREPEVVAPMTEAELRRAIEEPATRSGLSVEPGLTDLILEDLRALRGADDLLALLSHALLATWRRRTGGVLTMAGYRSAGGVARAVAMSGEEALRRLGPEYEPVARSLLVRLVHVDARGSGSRRRVPLADLRAGKNSVEGQVLAEFVRARLVTVDGDEAQIAHEALLRAWPRLGGWAETGRAALLVRGRLAEDAELWQRESRDPAYLYSGDRLATVQAVVGEPAGRPGRDGGGISAVEREFLDASRVRRHRRSRTARGVIAALATLALLTAAGAVGALVQGRQAMGRAAAAAAERDQALSRQVAAAASTARDTSLGAQLALAAYRLSATPQARGALLGALSRPVGARLVGHTAPVRRVAYRGDGRVAVTVSADSTARLWDVADVLRPKALGVVHGHTAGVVAAAFDPDGRVLATGSADGTARLWDVSDAAAPRALSTLKGNKDEVASVSFSPDGDTLATASLDGSMRLWDVSAPARAREVSVRAQPSGLARAAFSPEGSMVALTSAAGTVTLLDVRTPAAPESLAVLTSGQGGVRGVAFAPDGRHLATSSGTGAVELWDVTAARLVGTARGPDGSVDDIAFSPDGDMLAGASADATVSLWNVTDPGAPELVTSLAGFPDAVTGVAFSPDGRHLATSSADGVSRLWDAADTARVTPRARLAGHTGPVGGLAIDRAGRVVATASDDRTVRLWDVSDPAVSRPLSVLSGHTGQVTAAAFSPDGSRLVTVSLDRTGRVWDVSDPAAPRHLGTLTGHTGGVRTVAYSGDGRLVVTTGRDGRTLLWNVSDPAAPQRVAAPGPADARVSAAVFRPDGKVLAVGSGTSSVRLWDVSDPAEPRALSGFAAHTGGVTDLGFARDGRSLATTASDGGVRLWDVSRPRAPKRLVDLPGHSADVSAVAFAADGRSLVTASRDMSMRVWDVAVPSRPALWAVLSGRDVQRDVEFGPDGTFLVSASGTAAQLWGLNVEQASAHVCEASGPPITRDEWSRYVPGRPYAPPCAAAN